MAALAPKPERDVRCLCVVFARCLPSTLITTTPSAYKRGASWSRRTMAQQPPPVTSMSANQVSHEQAADALPVDGTVGCCRFQCRWHCLWCHGCSCDQIWQSGPRSGLQTRPPLPQPTLSLVALQQTPPPPSSSQVGTSALRSSPTIGSPPVVSQLSLPHTEVLDRVSSSAGRLLGLNNDPRLSGTVLNCWIPTLQAAKLYHHRRLVHHLVQHLVQANHWRLVHHSAHELAHMVRSSIWLCLHPHCCSRLVQCRHC